MPTVRRLWAPSRPELMTGVTIGAGHDGPVIPRLVVLHDGQQPTCSAAFVLTAGLLVTGSTWRAPVRRTAVVDG